MLIYFPLYKLEQKQTTSSSKAIIHLKTKLIYYITYAISWTVLSSTYRYLRIGANKPEV